MPQGNPLMQLIPFLLVFGIFYLLVIKPEKKKQQEHKKRLEALQKNDRVVTAGGAHGTVVNVKDTTVILRLDDSVRVEFDKDAISRVND
ncbi:MAG: preprotein translocase subunit YajC [Candidatus Omnitrophota bacterium]